jgi:hypothetical protein
VFDAAARDAVLAFLNGGLQSVVPTAAVSVAYASADEFTATVRVNPEDFGDAERLAVRLGVRGFVLLADARVHPATFLTPEFVASALRDLRASEPSAAFAYSLASKELHRCVEGVTVEYWGGADGLVKLRARVPEEDHAELERAQAVVHRILTALRPVDLVGRGAAAIIVEAVPGSEIGLALPSIRSGCRVRFEPRPPAVDIAAGYPLVSNVTGSLDHALLHDFIDDEAPAAALPAPAADPAAARRPPAACICNDAPADGRVVQAGENGAMSLGAYVMHGENLYAICSGHGLPSPDAIHANVTLRWWPIAGAKLETPLSAMHCINPSAQLDYLDSFEGVVCVDARPFAYNAPLQDDYLRHTRLNMIADISIFKLLPDAEHLAERVAEMRRMAPMPVLTRSVRNAYGWTGVGLPFWGHFQGDVHFFSKTVTVPGVPGRRGLRVCGFSQKQIRVQNGPNTEVVLLVNYVAQSDHLEGCKLAPQNGDSGGPVLQQFDGSERLHSFVRARAHAGIGADRQTYYTLTPAHFALQQVKHLLGIGGDLTFCNVV